MKYKDFEQNFSSSRVNRYFVAMGNSSSKAIKLYKANLKISQAFHPLLGVLEVILRNRLNDVLTIYFNDSNWITNQKSGFMSDSSLTFKHKQTGKTIINDFLKREINKAESRLKKAKMSITSGKIIAEQTFGFWTDLFEAHHYKLLIGKPIQIFHSLPTGHGRKEIKSELDKVRLFRNRINHNEPICFKGNKADFAETLEVYNSIIKLLKWIDPKIIKFVTDIDKVKRTINNAKKI